MNLPDQPDTGGPELAVAASESAAPANKKKTPSTARGFKGLNGVTVGGVIVDAVNQVTVLVNNDNAYFVIEAHVVNGVPVIKCTKHKVTRRAGVRARGRKPTINKFG